MLRLQELFASTSTRLDDWLGYDLYGNAAHRWVLAIACLLLAFLGLRLLRHVLVTRAHEFVERTRTIVDDLALDLVRHTGWAFFLALGSLLGSLFLQLPATTEVGIRRVFAIAFFIQAGIWANRIVHFTVRIYLERTQEDHASKVAVLALFGFFARVGIWSIVVLLALDNLGVRVTALITGLGIGGIAVGLALQSVLKDTFAALSIIIDKPFEVGDFLIVDDLEGKVEHIGLKTTRIRSLGGEELVFGNEDLLTSRIRNYKDLRERRVMLRFGIALDTPPEQAQEVSRIVREIIESVDETRFDRGYLKEITDNSLWFEVGYYVLHSDFHKMTQVRQQVNLALHERFGREGIRFAYPTRKVFLEEATGGLARG